MQCNVGGSFQAHARYLPEVSQATLLEPMLSLWTCNTRSTVVGAQSWFCRVLEQGNRTVMDGFRRSFIDQQRIHVVLE